MKSTKEFERGLPTQPTGIPGGCATSCSGNSRFEEGMRSKLRGGAWNNNEDNLRTANRNRNEPENRNNNIGFRLARDVEAELREWLRWPEPQQTMICWGCAYPLPDRVPDARRKAACVEQQRAPALW